MSTRRARQRSPPRAGSPAGSRPRPRTRSSRRWRAGTPRCRPGSASAWHAAPRALDPEQIGAEAGDEASSMLGATKPESRSCPVVLSERVAASFAGFIGGALCADAVQRGRSPFADRLGDELASAAYVLADDGIDPGGLASAPFDAEGTPRRAHRADRGRQAARLPLRHLHRAPRRDALDRQRRPWLLPHATFGRAPRTWSSTRGSSPSSSCSAGGRRRLRHRRRRPPLRRQPGHRRLLGRRLGTGDPRRRAGRAAARVHDRRRSARHAGAPCRRPGPRRAGCRSAARCAPRRCWSARWRSAAPEPGIAASRCPSELSPWPLLDCARLQPRRRRST